MEGARIGEQLVGAFWGFPRHRLGQESANKIGLMVKTVKISGT